MRLLEVRNLKKHFPLQKGLFGTVTGTVKAVDGVSFYIDRGETLGLVGETGCGKTTTGRTILRAVEPTSGEILFHFGDAEPVDFAALQSREEIMGVRRRTQMIFQDPYGSLSPRMTVRDVIAEPLIAHGLAKGSELDDRVREVARRCQLKVEHLRRYPHAFSGGQRQRIGIARALAPGPQFIVCDEPVSALDVSIQAQILNLLQELQQESELTYLFIAHDLSVVEHIADRVAVMYVGHLVEMADAEELFSGPLHPYTEALVSAIPMADPHTVMEAIPLSGTIPDPANPPSGCLFHPRCSYASERCRIEAPQLREYEPGHFVACHFADSLNLAGVH